MPFTRCSRASSSTSGLAFRLLLGRLLLGDRDGLGGRDGLGRCLGDLFGLHSGLASRFFGVVAAPPDSASLAAAS